MNSLKYHLQSFYTFTMYTLYLIFVFLACIHFLVRSWPLDFGETWSDYKVLVFGFVDTSKGQFTPSANYNHEVLIKITPWRGEWWTKYEIGGKNIFQCFSVHSFAQVLHSSQKFLRMFISFFSTFQRSLVSGSQNLCVLSRKVVFNLKTSAFTHRMLLCHSVMVELKNKDGVWKLLWWSVYV